MLGTYLRETYDDVVCTHCKAKQVVRVAIAAGGGYGLDPQTITCIKCKRDFADATVLDKIVDGPFAL